MDNIAYSLATADGSAARKSMGRVQKAPRAGSDSVLSSSAGESIGADHDMTPSQPAEETSRGGINSPPSHPSNEDAVENSTSTARTGAIQGQESLTLSWLSDLKSHQRQRPDPDDDDEADYRTEDEGDIETGDPAASRAKSARISQQSKGEAKSVTFPGCRGRILISIHSVLHEGTAEGKKDAEGVPVKIGPPRRPRPRPANPKTTEDGLPSVGNSPPPPPTIPNTVAPTGDGSLDTATSKSPQSSPSKDSPPVAADKEAMNIPELHVPLPSSLDMATVKGGQPEIENSNMQQPNTPLPPGERMPTMTHQQPIMSQDGP